MTVIQALLCDIRLIIYRIENTKQKIMRSVAVVYNVGESEQQIIICAVGKIKSNNHLRNDCYTGVAL